MVEKGIMPSCIHLGVPTEVQFNKNWAQALQDPLQFHTRFNMLATIIKYII